MCSSFATVIFFALTSSSCPLVPFLIRSNAHALYIHKLSTTADRKALSEEFGELLGDESIFTELLHRAIAEKFGFLYVTLGSEPKFFSSYKSEFRLSNTERGKDADNRGREN